MHDERDAAKGARAERAQPLEVLGARPRRVAVRARRGALAVALLLDGVDVGEMGAERVAVEHEALELRDRDDRRRARLVGDERALAEEVLFFERPEDRLGRPPGPEGRVGRALLRHARRALVDDVEPRPRLALGHDARARREDLDAHAAGELCEDVVGEVPEEADRLEDAQAHLVLEEVAQRAEEPREVVPADLVHRRRLERRDVGVARFVQDERHLAEVVARAEPHEHLLLLRRGLIGLVAPTARRRSTGRLGGRLASRALDRAAAHEEEVVARLALGDDARALGVRDFRERVGDLGELRVADVREELDFAQKLDAPARPGLVPPDREPVEGAHVERPEHAPLGRPDRRRAPRRVQQRELAERRARLVVRADDRAVDDDLGAAALEDEEAVPRRALLDDDRARRRDGPRHPRDDLREVVRGEVGEDVVALERRRQDRRLLGRLGRRRRRRGSRRHVVVVARLERPRIVHDDGALLRLGRRAAGGARPRRCGLGRLLFGVGMRRVRRLGWRRRRGIFVFFAGSGRPRRRAESRPPQPALELAEERRHGHLVPIGR
mmetsp:Transcript_20288/g.81034  ORF Transcript_20288/g.81034 Transcript_20288/m.81034 type:complete len:555 (-) Transcript_20288:32-1696(-)